MMQFHFWAHTQKEGKQSLKEAPARPRSQQRYLQQPKGEATQVSVPGGQSQEDKRCMTPLTYGPPGSQVQRDGAAGAAGGNGELLFPGHGAAVPGDDEVLQTAGGDGCTTQSLS